MDSEADQHEQARARIGELERLLEAHRRLTEDVGGFLWRTDLRGRLLFVHAAAAEILGHEGPPPLGASMRQFLSAASAREVAGGVAATLFVTPAAPVFQAQVEYRLADGRLVPGDISITAERDVGGRVIGLVGLSRRLAERRPSGGQINRERAMLVGISRALLSELGATLGALQAKAHATSKSLPARGRVLVVDDVRAGRQLVRNLLIGEHEVVTTGSGKEAQELLLRDAAFDAIVCDLSLAELSGVELHAWLAARDPALASKVVFLSKSGARPAVVEPLFGVASHPLERPTDREAVRAQVRQLVSRSRRPA